ncbi:MAG: helix-turn-helix domain-containing protein, partial [Candidatus ainarchaeum sp.]|nr:helix-turn-helix domain-containing protein [Candidatus ainarchaeum sp.]
MREVLLMRTIALLKEKGFVVESFLQTHSCFDIAARRHGLLFVAKVLNNIDALREEQAFELKRIAGLFNAIAIVIGEKSKAFTLRENSVYERYGLNVLSFRGFSELLEKNLPSVKYFKGREIVELDSEKLRKRRKEMGFTLEELAEKLDSTTESVHRYEKGANVSLGKAEALEDILGVNLIKKIDLFEEQEKPKELFDKKIEDEGLEKIHDLGVELAVFSHAPFRATARKETLIIGKGNSRIEIVKKAVELSHARHVFSSSPMIIAKESRQKTIGHVPVIEEEELQSISRFNELEELIR